MTTIPRIGMDSPRRHPMDKAEMATVRKLAGFTGDSFYPKRLLTSVLGSDAITHAPINSQRLGPNGSMDNR